MLRVGGTGLSHCPRCRRAAASRLLQSCSPALQRDSAQPHSAPSPFLQPWGGTHTLPTSSLPSHGPCHPQSHPPDPYSHPAPSMPTHGLLLQPQCRQGPPLQG